MACHRKHTDELLGDHTSHTNACRFTGEGSMCGRRGPITAAMDVPEGPVLAELPMALQVWGQD